MFDADPNYQLLAIGADAPLTYFRWLFSRKIEAEKGAATRGVSSMLVMAGLTGDPVSPQLAPKTWMPAQGRA